MRDEERRELERGTESGSCGSALKRLTMAAILDGADVREILGGHGACAGRWSLVVMEAWDEVRLAASRGDPDAVAAVARDAESYLETTESAIEAAYDPSALLGSFVAAVERMGIIDTDIHWGALHWIASAKAVDRRDAKQAERLLREGVDAIPHSIMGDIIEYGDDRQLRYRENIDRLSAALWAADAFLAWKKDSPPLPFGVESPFSLMLSSALVARYRARHDEALLAFERDGVPELTAMATRGGGE